MRIDTECPLCIKRMVQQTAQQATSDPQLRQRAIDAAMDIVKPLLAADKVPTQVAGEAQRAVRQVTGNRDPYREWKDKEMSRAERLFGRVRPKYSNDIRSLVTLSAIGNMPDFFRDIAVVEHEMTQPAVFARDHINRLADILEASRSTLFISDENMDNLICFVPGVNLCMKKVMFLADNAGECYFDAPLVKDISQVMRINYVVKTFPVQNDLTQEDLVMSGLHDSMGATVMTSTDTAGLDLSLVSPRFREEFYSSDLVIAKGMGHWETLSEMPGTGRVFHLLVAKCPPVARALEVPVGCYVALLR